MSTNGLSEKQLLVYNFLMKNRALRVPPTVREIREATGIKSTSTVHAALSSLEQAGLIERDAKSSRSVRVSGTGESAMVPVLGKVTAGVPILAVEDIDGYIPYPVSTDTADSLFALKVSGFSMKNIGILDGDIIIADRDAPHGDGDIVVALTDGEATVKRLIKKPGEKPYLMPENPDFDPIYPEYMEVIGRVVGSFRRY